MKFQHLGFWVFLLVSLDLSGKPEETTEIRKKKQISQILGFQLKTAIIDLLNRGFSGNLFSLELL